MRHFLVLLGLLLLPSIGHAQITATALSPWVEEVLNIADRGISFAQSTTPLQQCSGETKISFIETARSYVDQRLSPILQMEIESQQLSERTVCFDRDRRLLQNKLTQIMEEMGKAIDDCRMDGLNILELDYDFVIKAYQSFLRGGYNPSYRDDLLRYKYPFENQSQWESIKEPVFDSGSTLPVCAFTTDYAPHAIGYIPTLPGAGVVPGDMKSYGCDSDVLARIPAPLDNEAGVFKEFIDKTQEFASTVYDTVSRALSNINDVLRQVSQSSGTGSSLLPGSLPPPPHDVRTGCLMPLPPGASSPPDDLEHLILAYPDYYGSINARPDGAGGYIFDPEPGKELPVGVLFQPVVDFFLTTDDVSILSRMFMERREDAGQLRPLPKDSLVSDNISYLMALEIDEEQQMLRYISSNIEQEMAYLEGLNRDAMQRMGGASVPLESAVDALVEVVENQLPKEYIPQLTLFLGRSCVDGHCQETLKSVAKRVFNPYCHPYTSGKYTDEEAHKKCYCDPAIQGSWSDWNKYCDENFAADQATYDALPETLVPACIEETLSSSSSSTSS